MKPTSDRLFPDLETTEASPRTTGILPSQEIRQFIESKRIVSSVDIGEEQVQPASIDLRLGSVAYRVRASFLPGLRSTVEDKISGLHIAQVDLSAGAVFERGCVYIVPLMESLALPRDIEARANPKSTTGRLDIFMRLITDYGNEFERVARGYRGRLYAEVVSRTFTLHVREGLRLNQLRFIRGSPPSYDSTLVELDERETLLYEDEDSPARPRIDRGLRIGVKLSAERKDEVVAYKARKNAPSIDLAKRNYYNPQEFWEEVYSNSSKNLVLDPGDFYLLASDKKVRIPPDHAAEMVPYDPSIGEFRVHYAGFFDPGFGYGLSDIPGTLAVLEVRAHEVPIMIEHGQEVARLVYSPMIARPDKIYGKDIGSSYQQQGLSLSKQFKRSA
jgi:dCTP deaminase